MIQVVMWLLSLIPPAFKERTDLALENLALRNSSSFYSERTDARGFGGQIESSGFFFPDFGGTGRT